MAAEYVKYSTAFLLQKAVEPKNLSVGFYFMTSARI